MQRAVLVFAAGPWNRDPSSLNDEIVKVLQQEYRNDLVFAEWPISRMLRKINFKHIWVRKRGKEAVRKMAEYLKLFSVDEIVLLTSYDVIQEHQQLLRCYEVRFRVAAEYRRVSRDTLLYRLKKLMMGYTKESRA